MAHDDAASIRAAEAALTALQLAFTTDTHAPVMTADEHKAWAVGAGKVGSLAKNLLLKDKNKKLLLAVVGNERKVDMKKLGVHLVPVFCVGCRASLLFAQRACRRAEVASANEC